MGIERFKGSKVTQKIKFVGQDLEIVKLTVSQAIKVQDLVKELEESKDPEANLAVLLMALQFGAPDLSTMTLEDLKEFPMHDLTTLSNSIMKYSGMISEAK
jgi:hypothetical protein